jgi:uncharacterized protein (DUF924 family)
MQHDVDTILSFWFQEISPKDWWQKSSEFDKLIEQRFGALHKAAAACELFSWRRTARGRLAEILILDQFSRNIYRDQALAFASDSLALALAQTAIAVKADLELDVTMRSFLYMPFMHSESPVMHVEAIALFENPGMESNLNSERRHKDIIDRFGRFPHRNAILGRDSTPQEIEFLKTPGSSF